MTDELRAALERLKGLPDEIGPAPWYFDEPWNGFSGFRDHDGHPIAFTASPKECRKPHEFHNFVVNARNRYIPALSDFVLAALEMIGPHEQTCQVMIDHGTRGCRCGQDDLQAAAERLLEGLK